MHCGSFDDPEKVNYGIDLVNAQNSDVILFTGDIVNDQSSELKDWKDDFARLSARDGVFSVLGNHDYGDYRMSGQDEATKKADVENLKRMQSEMGFRMLLDNMFSRT